MSEPNKHGLRRSDLTAEQKLKIRQDAGFGCVNCGLAFCEYEHIEPEFADATEHDVDKMTLLCQRCHSTLPKEYIWKAKRDPFCKKNGGCGSRFYIGDPPFTASLGSLVTTKNSHLLVIDNTPLLSIGLPEAKGGPYLLSAKFYDSEENLVFEIDKNEWRSDGNIWDLECVSRGNEVTLRKGKGDIILSLTCQGIHGVRVDRLEMYYRSVSVSVRSGDIFIDTPTNKHARVSNIVLGSWNGISINSDKYPALISFNDEIPPYLLKWLNKE